MSVVNEQYDAKGQRRASVGMVSPGYDANGGRASVGVVSQVSDANGGRASVGVVSQVDDAKEQRRLSVNIPPAIDPDRVTAWSV